MPDDRQASDEDEDFSLEVYATSAARRVLKGGSASERGTRSSSAGSGRGERGVAAVDSGASTRAVDVPMTKEDKALARKEAAASKKRQRQEAVRVAARLSSRTAFSSSLFVYAHGSQERGERERGVNTFSLTNNRMFELRETLCVPHAALPPSDICCAPAVGICFAMGASIFVP